MVCLHRGPDRTAHRSGGGGGRPPRQGLPLVRAPDRRGKAVAASGRAGVSTTRSGGGRQRQPLPIMVDDVDDEDEEEEDNNMMNQQSQV
jgi:hypothetical protein